MAVDVHHVHRMIGNGILHNHIMLHNHVIIHVHTPNHVMLHKYSMLHKEIIVFYRMWRAADNGGGRIGRF